MSDTRPRYRDEEESGHIESSVDKEDVVRWTGIATAISLGLNLLIFFVGREAGWIPEDMPNATQAFSLVSVILASVIPVLLFGVLMLFLGNHAPRASRLFEIILLVVLVIAVMVPFTLQGLEDSFRYVLVAMHIVTAGSILLLVRLPEN